MKERNFDLQGHRGARGLRPENTWPAFEAALEIGVSTLEMDVVISRDGHVVVSHDPWFSDLICTKPDGSPVHPSEAQSLLLYAMDYETIAGYDCGRRKHPAFPEQVSMPACKPLLSEIIERAEAYSGTGSHSPVRYNIEIKSTPAGDDRRHPRPGIYARLLYHVLQNRGVASRTTVQSFDPRALEAMRRIDTSVRLAYLVTDEDSFPAVLERLSFIPDVYSPDHRVVDAALVAAVHERRMQILPWTVNETDRMRQLIALGVDGLITDYPDRAQVVLTG